MSLFELLQSQHNDLTNQDVAVLADWANEKKTNTPNDDWKKAYALIREGADLLLRRIARSTAVGSAPPNCREVPIHESVPVDYFELRRTLGDFDSAFYGPHGCDQCGVEVVRRAREQGGERYERKPDRAPAWAEHHCRCNGPSEIAGCSAVASPLPMARV